MRRTLFLSFGVAAYAVPFLQDTAAPPPPTQTGALENTGPQKGIGSGVTQKISPSSPPPAACKLNYNGEFAIAALKAHVRLVASAPDQKASNSSSSDGLQMFPGLGAAGGVITKPSPAVVPAPAAAAVTPKANVKPVVDPPAKEDTVTVKSTRTHTRTVTVQRTVVNTQPTYPVGVVNAYMVSQIEDGQIQAPTKASPISITVLKTPPPTTAAGKPAPVPATATRPVSGLLITQIGDGQIQAPTAPVAIPPPKKFSSSAAWVASSAAAAAPVASAWGAAPKAVPAKAGPLELDSSLLESDKAYPDAAAKPAGSAAAAKTASLATVAASASPAKPAAPAKSAAPAVSAAPLAPAADAEADDSEFSLSQYEYTSGDDVSSSVAPMAGMPMLKRAVNSSNDGLDVSLVVCKASEDLKLSLKDGVLTDSKNRIGYIASNYQLQYVIKGRHSSSLCTSC